MTDTIDLLEAIGRDASLRHATTEELMVALEQVQATDALMETVASGDRMILAKELGSKPLVPPQGTLGPAHEEEPEEEEEEPLEKQAPDHRKSQTSS